MLSVDTDFETVWGWRVCDISETWRRHNEARKLVAGQPQKRIAAGGTSSQTVGRHLSELKIRGPSATKSSDVPVNDGDDSHQLPSSRPSGFPEDSYERTLPSLKALGLLDLSEGERTHVDTQPRLPPLSKGREW
jgi:hypothetical protein